MSRIIYRFRPSVVPDRGGFTSLRYYHGFPESISNFYHNALILTFKIDFETDDEPHARWRHLQRHIRRSHIIYNRVLFENLTYCAFYKSPEKMTTISFRYRSLLWKSRGLFCRQVSPRAAPLTNVTFFLSGAVCSRWPDSVGSPRRWRVGRIFE